MSEDNNLRDTITGPSERISDGCAAALEEPEVVSQSNQPCEHDVSEDDDSASRQSRAAREEMWEERRRFNNMRRREKEKASHRARVAAARAAEEALLARMTPEQLAEWHAAQDALRTERSAAAAAQAALVEAALAGGGPGRGPHAPLRVVIDCSFSPTAPPKEMRSLVKQIENSSAFNKRYPRPACLTLTTWGEPLATVAAPFGAAGWRVVKMAAAPEETFGGEAVVVMSPDASEPLLDLDADRVYVIGGIVDRTHRKGLTLNYAEARRLECRRLPVAEFAEPLGMGKGVRKCPVLNIDDVVKALIIFHDTRDWVKALDAAISPRRRKPQPLGDKKQPGTEAGPDAEAEAEAEADGADGQPQRLQLAGKQLKHLELQPGVVDGGARSGEAGQTGGNAGGDSVDEA